MAAREVRAGVIGVGYLGALHAAKYHRSPDVRLVGVYDVDEARAAQVAAEYGCKAFGSAEELFSQVEAVSIAVPTAAHLEAGLAAAAHGVHMLMEKPLAADLDSAGRLVEAVERAAVLLQVGHLERFNPVFRDVREFVRRPRFIECHRLSPFAGRGADTNVIFDVMIHDLDLIDYLVGDEIAHVHAVGVPVLSQEADIANARIEFAGGCIANVTASRVSLKRERKLRIFEPDKYVSIDFDAGRAVIARRKSEPLPAEDSPMAAVDVDERDVGSGDALLAEVAAFVDCVRSSAPPMVGAREGLRAMQTADRVVQAMSA